MVTLEEQEQDDPIMSSLQIRMGLGLNAIDSIDLDKLGSIRRDQLDGVISMSSAKLDSC